MYFSESLNGGQRAQDSPHHPEDRSAVNYNAQGTGKRLCAAVQGNAESVGLRIVATATEFLDPQHCDIHRISLAACRSPGQCVLTLRVQYSEDPG